MTSFHFIIEYRFAFASRRVPRLIVRYSRDQLNDEVDISCTITHWHYDRSNKSAGSMLFTIFKDTSDLTFNLVCVIWHRLTHRSCNDATIDRLCYPHCTYSNTNSMKSKDNYKDRKTIEYCMANNLLFSYKHKYNFEELH